VAEQEPVGNLASRAAGTNDGRRRKEPHLHDYLRVLYLRRWVFLATAAAVVSGALALALIQTPIYRSSCSLLLQPTRARVTDIKEVYDPTFGAASGGEMLHREYLETQYQLILSRFILEKTFREFGYDKMRQFSNSKDPIGDFRKLFFVAGRRNTYVADVSFEWKDPDLATRTLARHIEEYLLASRERGLGVTESGLEALRRKAEELRPDLEQKALDLQNFRAAHNMVSLEESQDTVVEKNKEISQNLTKAELARIEAETRLNNIRAALERRQAPEDMPEVLGSETVRDLKLEYIRMKLRCSDLSDSLGPNHPLVKAATATLATVAERLEVEVRDVLASAEADYQRAKQREDELVAAAEQQKKAVLELNGLEREYRTLKDAEANLRRAYNEATQRIQDIEIALAAGTRDDGVFIDTPPNRPVEPIRPRKLRMLALAALFGVLLGAGLCFFLEYLDTTIKTKEEAEALLNAPVLGFVPSMRNGHAELGVTGPIELTAFEKPRAAVAEAFRSIRTALSFTRMGAQSHQFVVTSALASEGKSLVSVNLALTLAQSGKKVLLVDADLRRPRIHRVFCVAPSPGLSNLLAAPGEDALDRAIRSSQVHNLSLMPSGPIPPNPAELLESSRMVGLVRALSERFDCVIYDTPPTINVTDAVVLARHVHGALLVVRSFATDRAAAGHARELLTESGARLLGVIINGVEAPPAGYGRYGGYYAGYSNYARYYGDAAAVEAAARGFSTSDLPEV
jgi:capsular exopolysaccharide synthesis family protein